MKPPPPKPAKRTSLATAFQLGLQNATVGTEESAFPPATLPLEQLRPMPDQVRRYFDEEGLRKLSADIAERGVLQPLIVRPVAGNKFEIVAGERRFRAARMAGLKAVPVVVRELDGPGAAQANLLENINRSDINPYEVALGVFRVLSMQLSVDDQQLERLLRKAEAVASGRSARASLEGEQRSAVERIEAFFAQVERWSVAAFVNNLLPLRSAPEDVKRALDGGELEYTKALVIMRVEDAKLRTKLIQKALQGASLRDLKALAETRSRPDDANDPVATRLGERWNANVRVRASRNGGEVRIRCSDVSAFQRLLALLERGR
ncbi:MAG: ParB/RepB/Spo0J family partition protein [Pleurocapsa sp. SU_196_0]|nr:ParB/RepB/Spo0J family partition protein [Pleurocapsa sp. SU_196_0]